jgi:hypothetical protein
MGGAESDLATVLPDRVLSDAMPNNVLPYEVLLSDDRRLSDNGV